MSHTWKSHVPHFKQSCPIYPALLQGGGDSQYALSCRLFSTKEPLIIRLFCGKWPIKIRHPRVAKTHITVCLKLQVVFHKNAINYKALSTKMPLIIRLFCGKWLIKIRHPMTLRHPVTIMAILLFTFQYTNESCHTYETKQAWTPRRKPSTTNYTFNTL